jgi:hypothetical protein
MLNIEQVNLTFPAEQTSIFNLPITPCTSSFKCGIVAYYLLTTTDRAHAVLVIV